MKPASRIKRVDILILLGIFVGLFIVLAVIYSGSNERHGLANYLAFAFPCLAGISAGAGLYLGGRDTLPAAQPDKGPQGEPPRNQAQAGQCRDQLDEPVTGAPVEDPGGARQAHDEKEWVEIKEHFFYKLSLGFLLLGVFSYTASVESCRRPAMTTVSVFIVAALAVLYGTVVTRADKPGSSDVYAIQSGARWAIVVLLGMAVILKGLLGSGAIPALGEYFRC